jgi:membrane fusion protein, multidrug efflux system
MSRLLWLLLITMFIIERPLSGTESMIDKATELIEQNRPLNDSLNDNPLESPAMDEIEPIQVTLEPVKKAELAAQIASPVTQIHKYLGERFEKGDLLMQLDDSLYKANLEKGVAALAKAKSILLAKKKLFQDSIASFFDVKDAESLVATAKAEVALAQKQLEACTICAPFQGKVSSLLISEFELPQPGQPLIEIISDNILIGRMLVDANSWNKVAINKVLKIKVNETNQTIKAKIVRIGPMIDLASSSLKVEMEIEHNDSELMAGMTGITTLKEEQITDASIPTQPLVNPKIFENKEDNQ